MIVLAQKACNDTRNNWDDVMVDDEAERKGTVCFAAKLKVVESEGVYRVFLDNGRIQTVDIRSRTCPVYTVLIDGEVVDV